MPVQIFFCYAHEDEPLLNKLKNYLRPLQRDGLIDVWHDRDINAGAEWERVINEHLNTSQIILLLVSSDFMASEYCYSKEMKRAIERHERGEAHVIPIILRKCFWQRAPFNKLQVLPTDGKPVRSWPDEDEALYNVAEGIRKVAESLLANMKDPHYIYLQATSGEPVLFDSLKSQSASDWRVGEWDDSSFFFSEGALHLTINKNETYAPSRANATHFSDFAFRAEMTLIKGGGGGLVFRSGNEVNNEYRFYVGPDYTDLCYGYANTRFFMNTTIKALFNQTYSLTVVAKGSDIFLYINKRFIDKVQDNSASSGKIGLMAYNFQRDTHVFYRNAQVWDLTKDNLHLF